MNLVTFCHNWALGNHQETDDILLIFFFWKDFKAFILSSSHDAFLKECLTEAQINRMDNDIYSKGDKDKRSITNWRSITHISVIYNVIYLPHTLAVRIKRPLNKIISEDESEFMEGKSTVDKLRLT